MESGSRKWETSVWSQFRHFCRAIGTERSDLIEISGINGRNNSGQRSGTLP